MTKLDFVSTPTQNKERAREFDGETRNPGVCHMTHFSDPDGNVFMLHRRYAPHAS